MRVPETTYPKAASNVGQTQAQQGRYRKGKMKGWDDSLVRFLWMQARSQKKQGVSFKGAFVNRA
jgi:hypothetical protein